MTRGIWMRPGLGALACFLVVAAVFVFGEPGQAAALSVITQFEGLANSDNAVIAGSTFNPPDNGLAVGPSHVVQMVNAVGRITDKFGNLVSSFSLRSFFGIAPGFSSSDPRVLYDPVSRRWFAVSMNYSDTARSSSLILAVSSTDDPTGHFCTYRLGNPTSETFLQDYPFLGVSDDKVVVSYSGFDFTTNVSLGGGYYVMNKAQVSSCSSSTISVSRFAPQSSVLMKPARAVTSTSTAYMAAHSTTAVTVWIINGVPGVSPVTVSTQTVAMANTWVPPPAATQAGSSVPLDTDSRTQTVVWRDSSLWIGGNGACVPPGDATQRSCLRIVEVRTDTMSLRQDIVYGATGQHYFDPAVDLDGSGNLLVAFMESSTTDFLSVRATGRLATDALNTLQPAVVIRAGQGAETSVDPDTGLGRAGDYSGAATDPTDPLTVWVSSEYLKSRGDWGTYVAALTFSNPHTALVTAVLPSSRSVQISSPATAFLTAINAGSATASGVTISLGSSIPANFAFQTTDPTTNVVTGALNTPADIPPGAAQSFVVSITAFGALGPAQVSFTVSGSNAPPAPTITGVNTLLLSATSTPTPDIIALAATTTNDGTLSIGGTPGAGAFAVAVVNVGASGTLIASADIEGVSVPTTVSICQTNATIGTCLSAPAPSVTTQINSGATPTFGIFVAALGAIPFDPATNRIFVRFTDTSGATRGSTSVAVRTP